MSASLRARCDGLTGLGWGASLRLPEKTKLSLLSANLPDVLSRTRQPRDVVQLGREIHDCIIAGEALSRRQVREAPWCLWHKDIRLAENPQVLSVVLDGIAKAPRPSSFNALATAFVDRFDPEAVGMEAASACLKRLAGRWNTPWAQLHRDFAFFDMRNGPDSLAASVIAQNRSATDILRDYGIREMAAKSRYIRSVTISLLDQLANGQEPNHLLRLEKVESYALDDHGEPSFDGLLGKIAEALLLPFGQSRPERDLRDRYLATLLRILGDPRIRSPKNKWHQVPASLTDMVRSWLTEQSLRQFLDIVDQTAVEHMWKYRRAFWEAVYDAGLISEAWVAFGPLGATLARRAYGRDASFARLETDGKPVEQGHAVLLLKVGDGIIADWSHNGRYNIWKNSADRTAPQLYKTSYGSDEVRIVVYGSGNYETPSRISRSHMSSETYGWQNYVAQRLYEMTGVRLPARKYEVR
jgi:hypothetical protein